MGVADPVSLRLLAREVAQLLGRAEPERLLTLRDAKTEAGERLVDILPALRDELASHRHAAGPAQPDALVFPTSSGSRRDKDNARERVIRPVVAAAEALLAARGSRPCPPASPPTSSATRSPRSSTSGARIRPTSWVSSGTPTRASRSASTPTRCAARRAPRSA